MPVTVLVGEEAVVIVQLGPLTWVHAPVPLPGVFAAMVAVEAQID